MNRSRSLCLSIAGIALASAPLTACTGSTRQANASHQTSQPATAGTVGGTGAPQLQAGYVSTINTVLPSVVLVRTQRDLGSGIVFRQ